MKKPSKKASKTKKKAARVPVSRSSRVIKKTVRKSSRKTVSSAKKVIPRIVSSESTQAAESFSPQFELPAHYGNNHAVLCARDPWWVYAYWEIMTEPINRLLGQMRELGLRPEKAVLRVFDSTQESEKEDYFDIHLFDVSGNFAWPMIGDWMIDTGKPDREWIIGLGICAQGGRFFELVRSNRVRTPRYGISEVIDEEWMLPDHLARKIYGLSGDLASLRSSSQLQSSRAAKPS